jgi:hypothetical protein
MKLKKFIQKVDLSKYSKITVMDEWQATDYGDIYKGGDKVDEEILKECGDLEVVAGQDPNNLEIGGVYGNAIIKVPVEV